MKKYGIVLLTFWTLACSVAFFTKYPSGKPKSVVEIRVASATHDSPLVASSLTLTPSITFTPRPSFTPSIIPSLTQGPCAPLPQDPAVIVMPALPAGSPVELSFVQMVDSQIGWGFQSDHTLGHLPFSYGGHILRTIDAGKTWQNVTPPTGAYTRHSFFILDANNAWASNYLTHINSGAPRVWHTGDGGKTWQVSQPLTISETEREFYLPSRMQFIDQNTGWLLAGVKNGIDCGSSLREVLFRTTDAGNTWEEINSFLEDLGVCGRGRLAFIDSRTGWYSQHCVDRAREFLPFNAQFAEGKWKVMRTTDGGKSFSLDPMIPISPDLQNLEAANPEMDCGVSEIAAFAPDALGIQWSCFMEANRKYYSYFSLTNDAGRTWNSWKPAYNEFFLDATHGWRLLLTRGQFLQQTTDSGVSWTTLKTVEWEGYAWFSFISEREGWALVGNDSALIHTRDGGKTWEEIKPVIASS